MHGDEQEIRQLVSTWMSASKAGDVETVLSLMADDAVFLLPGQPVMRKTDFAARGTCSVWTDAHNLTAEARSRRSKFLETGLLCGRSSPSLLLHLAALNP